MSVSEQAIEDKPDMMEDLQPLSPKIYDFVHASTQLFFIEGHSAIKSSFHPVLRGISKEDWKVIESHASAKADLRAIEYYGHGFGEDDGFKFIVIQLKVPFENGYNLVKIVVPDEEGCCRLAGINIEVKT